MNLIKRLLLLGRKVMTKLDSILKSRDITLSTKVHLVKAMVFPVVMYGCESWNIKKAERWRIDAFELWCWRSLLRIPWTARRSTQSILKEISPEYSLEHWCWRWNSNTLATWCEELTSFKRPWCWERLKAGGDGDDRGWVGWVSSLTQWTWEWVNSGSWCWTGGLVCCSPLALQRVGHDWVTELNWAILGVLICSELNTFSCWRCHLLESWTVSQPSICSRRIARFSLLLNVYWCGGLFCYMLSIS